MTLEPFLGDYRKLKRRTKERWELTYMDDFIDSLLTKSRVCATTLPKINPRTLLEDEDRLEPRESALGEELDELDNDSDGQDVHKSEGSDGDELNGTASGNGHLDSD